jgi:hypothetical protein
MLKILFWLLVAINGALFALGQGLLGKHVVQRSEPQRLAQQLNPEQLVLTPPAAAPAKPAPIVAAAVSPPVAPPASGASTATPMTAAAAAPSPAPAATPPAVKATRASVAIPASTPAPAPTPTPTPTPTSASASPSASTPPLLACVEIGNFDPGEAKSFRARLAAAKLSTRPAQRNVQEVASYMVFIAAEDGREGAGRRAAELRRLGLNDFYIMPDSSPMRDAISLGIFKTEAAAKAYIGQLIPKGIRSARISERTASTNKVAFRLRDLNTADQAGFATLASAFPNQTRRDCRD